MAQTYQVYTSIRARGDIARGDYRVYMAGYLHDGRAYKGVVGEKPAKLLISYERWILSFQAIHRSQLQLRPIG